MKKKILAMCLVVALMATAIVGATLAYFTDDDVATNTFTVGNVEIDLTEPNWDAEGTDDAPEVYPGEALAKDPTVENTGKNPCFVRVSVSNLDQFGDKGDITLRTNFADGIDPAWELYEGYYYYKGVLAAGDTTVSVFDQIVMPTGLEGDEVAEAIVVTAEAVQAQGARPSWDNGVDGVMQMTVAEIAAWFDTCMA